MKTRSNTIIATGVAVAVLGALLVFAYGRSVRSGTGSDGPMVSALVASDDIAAGTKWEDAQGRITAQEVPVALRPVTAVDEQTHPVGRTSVRAISKGEVVTAAQFGAAAAAPAGGLEIPPGQNAVSVNLSVPQGVARYPNPGDLVNVYVTLKNFGRDNSPITRLVLTNVQVLANRPAGTDVATAAGNEVLLTLALTPPDSERLLFAKDNGSLWFGLVHPGDAPAVTVGHTFDTVLP